MNDANVAEVGFNDADAPARFTGSLRTTGFGVVRDHPISADSIDTIYSEWLAFFHSDAKWRYLRDDRHDGYFPESQAEVAKHATTRDLKEYYHVFSWGRYPAEVSDAARSFFDTASALAAELLRWVEANTPDEVRAGFTAPLPAMIDSSTRTLLRVLHYPPLAGDVPAAALRAAPHEDINLLTILPAATDSGLQLLDTSGVWRDVPCDRGALVVNVGDMLQEASNGYYRSTTHRVVNPVGAARLRSRVAMPLFLQPRPDVVLSPRYTAASYLAERLAELDRLAD